MYVSVRVVYSLELGGEREFRIIFPFPALGGAPSPGNATNHNHATAVTGGGATVTGSGGSNFKRQNTVDAATIKENSARVSASRPSAPKNSQPPGQLDTSEFKLCSRNNERLRYLR